MEIILLVAITWLKTVLTRRLEGVEVMTVTKVSKAVMTSPIHPLPGNCLMRVRFMSMTPVLRPCGVWRGSWGQRVHGT